MFQSLAKVSARALAHMVCAMWLQSSAVCTDSAHNTVSLYIWGVVRGSYSRWPSQGLGLESKDYFQSHNHTKTSFTMNDTKPIAKHSNTTEISRLRISHSCGCTQAMDRETSWPAAETNHITFQCFQTKKSKIQVSGKKSGQEHAKKTKVEVSRGYGKLS